MICRCGCILCQLGEHCPTCGVGDGTIGPPEPGCDACREIGPLLTAPGTSGRSWRCDCGTVWSHPETHA